MSKPGYEENGRSQLETWSTNDRLSFRYERVGKRARCWRCGKLFEWEPTTAQISKHWKAEFCGDDCVAEFAAFIVVNDQ